MKKIIFLSILMIYSFPMLAQDETTFHFGLKAAPSFAWLRTDSKNVSANGSKFGFSYGLMTEFNFTKRYAFATGIDIAYRGGKLKSIFTVPNTGGGDSIITAEQGITLQYVEIPLTLKLKTNEIGYLTYYLQFGVSPGLNIRAKADNKFTTQSSGVTNVASEDKADIKDDINSFNLSMIIGGGVEYTLSGSTTLLVGVQFNNGFLDVEDADNLKVNSNYLALTVGILF
ncbi:MAG TPA: porin family protein [Bacteroidia bacterium]|nr:porin family protein [Bacteroidia bacterium]